jgi:TATA-box binding protein (TBP) (component of TFIID and TFIIIB)
MSCLEVTNITVSFRCCKKFNFATFCDDPLKFPSNVVTVNGKEKKFNSMVERIDCGEKYVTALVYKTGSVVMVGANSEFMADDAIDRFLHEHHTKLLAEPKFSNYAFTFHVGHKVDLKSLYTLVSNHECISHPVYEVELFPALLVTRKDTNTKASIFHSGRVILTGCKTMTAGQEMYDILKGLLK